VRCHRAVPGERLGLLRVDARIGERLVERAPPAVEVDRLLVVRPVEQHAFARGELAGGLPSDLHERASVRSDVLGHHGLVDAEGPTEVAPERVGVAALLSGLLPRALALP